MCGIIRNISIILLLKKPHKHSTLYLCYEVRYSLFYLHLIIRVYIYVCISFMRSHLVIRTVELEWEYLLEICILRYAISTKRCQTFNIASIALIQHRNFAKYTYIINNRPYIMSFRYLN